MTKFADVGLLGFGEVGRMLGEDLGLAGVKLTVFDPKLADRDSAPARALHRQRAVDPAEDAAGLACSRDLVISAVTAAESLRAAQSVASSLAPGAVFLDLNSTSPATRVRVAEVVENSGARYVEAAVMAPFAPKRLDTTILLGGPRARQQIEALTALGFTGLRVFDESLGRAAAAKMCRSVIVKGMEALVSEAMLAGRHYRVEGEVLETLSSLFPHPDWRAHARYLLSRTLEHGTRRAEEMTEVAATVHDAGVDPWMSEACAARQAWASQFAHALEHEDLESLLDAVRDGTPACGSDLPVASSGHRDLEVAPTEKSRRNRDLEVAPTDEGRRRE